MLSKHYNKIRQLFERRRYEFLLTSTVLVLILPAFSGTGLVSQIVFVSCMSFLFIQSMLAANVRKVKKRKAHYSVLALILVSILDPLGLHWIYIDLLKGAAFVTFFIFIISYLVRFISESPRVNVNVLMTSINIYLLGGIIGAFLSFELYQIYPNAYILPPYMQNPTIVNFLYYSFITMSTVGYGDILPGITETQTLAYLMSVTGQLYVAIIIAFLVGKMLANPEK